MIPFPHRLTTGLAALAACITLASCSSTKNGSTDGVVDYTSPNTNMSKEEYPFDDNGNYREDWAARGAGATGVRDTPTDTALYTQPSDTGGPINHPAYTPDPEPTVASTTPRKSTSSSGTRSSSSSGSRKVAQKSSGSKSKPKPKPKPTSIYVKVKPGDTLFGLSKKYGVSVASIKSANGLSSNTIRDGRSLKIPKKK